jgi:hypothetical protein
MKNLVLVIGSLLLGVGLGMAATRREFSKEELPTEQFLAAIRSGVSNEYAGPKVVVVDGSTFDFGKMDRHAEGEHVFVIRNDGNRPLTLEKGQTTCKCTMSEMKDGELQPGESIPIKLTWTAKTGDANFSQSAEIKTSDPRQPLVRLNVFGKIIDALRADRAQLTLGTLSASEDATRKFRLHAFRGENQLAVTQHEFTIPEHAAHFTADFRPLTPDELKEEVGAKSGVEVSIHVKSGLPLGAVRQTIRLTTNLEEASPLDVPIEGHIVGDIVLVGPAFVVSDKSIVNISDVTSAKGKTVNAFILVKGPHRDETKLTLKSVEPSDSLQATLGEVATDNPQVDRYPITITIPPGSNQTNRIGLTDKDAGVIRVETTHPRIKEFVILVRYAITE